MTSTRYINKIIKKQDFLVLGKNISKRHFQKIITIFSLLLVASLVVPPFSSQVQPASAAPDAIFKVVSGLVDSDTLTTGDISKWGIAGSAAVLNAPRSVTEDATGMHIGTASPGGTTWSGWFAITPTLPAHLYHAKITLPNVTPTTGLYDAAVYVQQEMAQDARIDAMGCGADVFPTTYHWTVSLQAGNSTDEIVNQSIYTDTSPNQPTSRECTLITNGSNQLTAYIDGQKVFSSTKMNLNMPQPFNYYLEIQTNSIPPTGTMYTPTFTDYYATTSDSIKVKNTVAGSLVKVVDAVSGTTLASSTSDASGTALVDVGGFHMPINANVQVFDAGGINLLAQTAAPAGIYGGDIFNVGIATVPQASITVQAAAPGSADPNPHLFTSLTQGGATSTGFTPAQLNNLIQDLPLVVGVSNYVDPNGAFSHIFDHWEDGSTVSSRVYIPSTATSTLTATFRESSTTSPPTSLTSLTQYTTNINTPTITGNSPASSTIQLYDGANPIGAPVTSSLTGKWSIITPVLSNGPHVWSATAAVGTNVSPKSLPLFMTIDQVVPSVLITGNTVSNSQVTLAGTSSDSDSGIKLVEVSVDNSATFTKATPVVPADWSTWSFTTGQLTVGSHHFTATATDMAGNQNTNSVDVIVSNTPLTPTTTAVTTSQSPSVFGQSVTFTATVSGTGGTPTGTVTFNDGATNIGIGTLAGGTATLPITTLAAGAHSITAVYSGDGTFITSTSPAITQTVNKGGTTTTVTSNINPSTFGQSVTFTATVSPVAPAAGTRTGTVTFFNDGIQIGTGTLAGGIATFSISTIPIGIHSITATYGGDTNFNTSTSGALSQTVKGSTTTTVTSGSNPSLVGQSVTFTATVTGSGGTPTGTVTFRDNGLTIGTGTLSVAGIATFSTSSLALGSHPITAVYGGDANFNTSTSTTLTQTVSKASTTTTVTSDISPSAFGQSVTFTATVTGTGGTPSGTVTFRDGATTLGTGTLAGGVATFSTSALTGGTHSITAVYGGDAFFNTSTSPTLTQTVTKLDTTTTVTSSLSTSTFGQSVTFTATVTGTGGTPSGTVTFRDGATTLGTGTLAGGVATFSTAALAAGTHSITAVYAGNTNFNTSTSPTLTQTVNKGGTTTTVTSSKNPIKSAQSVTFTARVLPVSPAAGTPTGTVTFYDGLKVLGTKTLSTGTATFTLSKPTIGTHTITVIYAGSNNFNTSTSPVLTQTVTR